MKDRNELTVSVIRMLLAEIRNREIELRNPATNEDVLGVLQSQAKKRRESVAQFSTFGRQDLADREAEELKVIEGYLPPKMTAQALSAAIAETIKETGAASPADFGKVMKAVMAKVRHSASGEEVSRKLKEILK